MNTIIVQQSEDAVWMTKAMHLACALARNQGGHIVVLRLALANNPGLLGWGITPPTTQEEEQIALCAAIAQDYGVAMCDQVMQYVTFTDALAQAAEHLNAVALFARIPNSRFSFWRQLRFWNLKRQLPACQVYPLDEDFVSTSTGYLFPITIGDRERRTNN